MGTFSISALWRELEIENVPIFQANTMNPRGQISQETLGNGVVTTRSFDAVTGWVSGIQSGIGGGSALQKESYLSDLVGNITQRQNNALGLTENFYYDNLYRLQQSTLGGVQNLAITYDALGNIATRSDIAADLRSQVCIFAISP